MRSKVVMNVSVRQLEADDDDDDDDDNDDDDSEDDEVVALVVSCRSVSDSVLGTVTS